LHAQSASHALITHIDCTNCNFLPFSVTQKLCIMVVEMHMCRNAHYQWTNMDTVGTILNWIYASKVNNSNSTQCMTLAVNNKHISTSGNSWITLHFLTIHKTIGGMSLR